MASAEVYILGQKYTIKAEASEEHLRDLATLIEGKVREVCSKAPANVTTVQALVLTLFSMADDVQQLSKGQEELARNIEKKAAILTSLFD